MNILALVCFILFVVTVLLTALGIGSFFSPGEWSKSKGFEKIIYKAGPLALFFSVLSFMLYFILSLILVFLVLF